MPIDGGARRSRLSRNARYTASLRSPCSRITNFIDAPSLNNGLLIPIEIRPHVGTALAEARLSERLAQNPNFLAHNHKTCSVPLVADRREMMLRQCERRRILQESMAARAPNQWGRYMFYSKTIGVIAAAGLAFSLCSPAKADCNMAISSYNSALDDISTYLKRYTRCLDSSNGTDDCSSEFRRLRSAQSDFESAVSEYQLYCHR